MTVPGLPCLSCFAVAAHLPAVTVKTRGFLQASRVSESAKKQSQPSTMCNFNPSTHIITHDFFVKLGMKKLIGGAASSLSVLDQEDERLSAALFVFQGQSRCCYVFQLSNFSLVYVPRARLLQSSASDAVMATVWLRRYRLGSAGWQAVICIPHQSRAARLGHSQGR